MTAEIQSLMTKARRSLAAANVLRERDDHDFAASRPFYAMFYVAEALLAEMKQYYWSHSAVMAAYGKEFAKTQRLDPKFHRWMIDSEDLRCAGDYGSAKEITPDQSAEACAWAAEFIEAGEKHFQAAGS